MSIKNKWTLIIMQIWKPKIGRVTIFCLDHASFMLFHLLQKLFAIFNNIRSLMTIYIDAFLGFRSYPAKSLKPSPCCPLTYVISFIHDANRRKDDFIYMFLNYRWGHIKLMVLANPGADC